MEPITKIVLAVVCGVLGSLKAASYAKKTGLSFQGMTNIVIGGLLGWSITDLFVPVDGKVGQVVVYSLMAGVVGGYVMDAAIALTPKLASAIFAGWVQNFLKGIGIDVDFKTILNHHPGNDESDILPTIAVGDYAKPRRRTRVLASTKKDEVQDSAYEDTNQDSQLAEESGYNENSELPAEDAVPTGYKR